jgi:acyl-CoA synthetase (AMP-forming)/AMP-acid ligase II
MLDLRQYTGLGAALTAALDRWPNETCLIEADRDREKVRLTYSDFKEMARPLCRALQDADFKAGDRAAIVMTNQSKWLISAYSIFFCGGVLVPLDGIFARSTSSFRRGFRGLRQSAGRRSE